MSLSCSAGKSLCHGFCARKLWNAGRAKELPGSIFPASALQPLSCMIRDPPSLQSSPCPALPVPPWAQPYLLRAGRARQQECHLIPAARDLGSPPHPCPAPSQHSEGLGGAGCAPSPAPRVCSCSQHPWDSLCTCGCLYWGTVYILGSIMSISGYKCDLSVHIHFSHIYPLLASQEWESFGLFCAAQTLKRKKKRETTQILGSK